MGSPFSVSMGEGFLSAEAIADPPPFDRLRAVMLYDDLARQLVSRMKYSDRSDLARWMGLWMVRAGHDLLKDVDVIVPVPLHPSRLRQRRYNQAAELSRSIARKAKVDFKAMALQRKRSTRQQVGLTEKERDRNVSGAFIVPERQKIEIQGRRVLLIDDVYTTGATAKAATRALKRGGASAIDVLVFAKVETYQV
jgi:ComF family protein